MMRKTRTIDEFMLYKIPNPSPQSNLTHPTPFYYGFKGHFLYDFFSQDPHTDSMTWHKDFILNTNSKKINPIATWLGA